MRFKIIAIMIAASLVLISSPVLAETLGTIDIIRGFPGGDPVAVLDGHANGQTETWTPDSKYGASGKAWGNYQQYGWLATEWQRMSGGPTGFENDFIWVNDFNVMTAITNGGDWNPTAADPYLHPGTYNAADLDTGGNPTAFAEVGVFVLPGDDRDVKKDKGFISEDQRSGAKAAGTFYIDSIGISQTGSVWNTDPEYLRDGAITLNGEIGLMIGGEEQRYAVSWTLVDHSGGNPSVVSVLNGYVGHTQINLNTGGTPEYGHTPEPGTMLLFGTCIAGMAWIRRRKGMVAKRA